MPEPREPKQVPISSREAPAQHGSTGVDATKRDDPLAELATMALNGCPAAERKLLRKLAPHLRRVVREILGPGGDADDCQQEALVAVANALATFRGDCTFLHFAIRIAIRYAVNARRRSNFTRQRTDRVAQLEKPLIWADHDSGATALASRRWTELRTLLARLPAGQARSFALHAVFDYSPKEISAATGVPVNTVRSRIRLAREAMRRQIEHDSALSELFMLQQ
jgi:RNA polymerase sigma-70 factor (ECF subfamily)